MISPKQDMQCMHNITWGCVHATNAAMEKQ